MEDIPEIDTINGRMVRHIDHKKKLLYYKDFPGNGQTLTLKN